MWVEQTGGGACGAEGRVRATRTWMIITACLTLLACADESGAGGSEGQGASAPSQVPAPPVTGATDNGLAGQQPGAVTPPMTGAMTGAETAGAGAPPAVPPPVVPTPQTPVPADDGSADPGGEVPGEVVETPVDATPALDGDPVPSAGCGSGSSPGAGDYSINVDGTNRTYIVAVPAGYDANKPYRLIFTWHYLGGSASGIARGGYYGLESRSAGSAIFVSAEGIDAGWANTGGRDVALASALLDWMKSNYCVDEARVFSAGFSYGAIMSNTVGCALGDQFRAIAPMAGSGPRTFGGSGCTGKVAAWLAHGTSDTTVSFASGQASRDHWLSTNGCGTTTTSLGDCVAYDGCDEGYPVHWCEFSGGHTQPRFGPDAIWAFFEQF